MFFPCAGGRRGGLRGDDAILIDCRYCGVVLSEKGEDEGRWACWQVIHGAESEGTKHGCHDRREKEGGGEDAEEK